MKAAIGKEHGVVFGLLHSSTFIFLLSSFILHPSSFSLAGLPQPLIVYYGQAKDWFGWPYTDNATVILLRGTNECARQPIKGSLSPGVNFALQVPFDDGRDTNRYVRNAVRAGDAVSVVVDDCDGRKTVMENGTVPAVTTPGDMILVNVTAATDADGDRLPDEWEQVLIDWGLHPNYTNIWDINAGDDYDGDGQSNGDEYRAGTFAFLDYDYFFVEHMERTGNGRLGLDFLSVLGKAYNLQYSTNLYAGIWTDCEYSLSDTGALQTAPTEGDGAWFSFFVPIVNTFRAFRLTVR